MASKSPEVGIRQSFPGYHHLTHLHDSEPVPAPQLDCGQHLCPDHRILVCKRVLNTAGFLC